MSNNQAVPWPPYENPAGRFHPAPTARRRRHLITMGVWAVVICLLTAPIVVDAAVADRDTQYRSSSESLEQQVMTYQDWPVDFGALGGCTRPTQLSGLGIATFECEKTDLAILGMGEVKDPPLAANRAIRAITFSDKVNPQSLDIHRFTQQARAMGSCSLSRAGVDSVWISDPYETAGVMPTAGVPGGDENEAPGVADIPAHSNHPGAFNAEVTGPQSLPWKSHSKSDSPRVLNRALSFVHPDNHGSETMVTVQVSANHPEDIDHAVTQLVQSIRNEQTEPCSAAGDQPMEGAES